MKSNYTFLLLLILALGMVGCKDDSAAAGSSLLDNEDKIVVFVDTFMTHSDLIKCDSVVSWPDSLMLGEIANSYGTMQAQILAQFACPQGFAYPQSDSTRIDSIEVCLCYSSYFGDGYSPLAVDIKRMDLATFEYSSIYATNIDPRLYVSEGAPSILTNEKMVVAADNSDTLSTLAGSTVHVMRAHCSDEFVEWFAQTKQFTTQAAFDEWFKGLYIYPTFGGSTVLNITDLILRVHYTFSYKKGDRDTVVHDVKELYANSEVRQVNAIQYPDQQQVFEKLQQDSNYYNYILAPANIYTRIEIPMHTMEDSILSKVGDKRPYVNMAKLSVCVTNVYDGATADRDLDDWAQPVAYMLLVKESALQRFFEDKELPSDTCAILASLSYSTEDDVVSYYYTYDLSPLLTNQLRKVGSNPDLLKMVLVPVDVQTATSSSSTTIIAVKQQQNLSATQIYSAINADNPISLEVIFSGF